MLPNNDLQNNEQNINPINTNENNNNNENDNNRKSNTFNLVIGIATLLIALLGATFAYFSATARSAENDVTVKSAYVSITYDGGTQIKATNIIPATLNVALSKYQKNAEAFTPTDDNPTDTDYDQYTSDIARRCVDAKGREVCYVYQFSVTSDGADGDTTDIVGSIKINTNEFDNLSYVLYEVTFAEEDGNVLKDKYGFDVVNTYNLVSNFNLTDSHNPDYAESDYSDVKFEKFAKPVDIIDENDNVTGTTYPVACIFGYSDDYEEKAIDDTTRCSSYTLRNKEKHTYQLVIWLDETGEIQPEQGLTFEGTVAIEVAGGFSSDDYSDGRITGKQ